MKQDPKKLFQEVWEAAERRVSVGKHSKDFIRFFLTDGTSRRFDVPLMQNDHMKEEFMSITLEWINCLPVEAILVVYEVWFLEVSAKPDTFQVDEYLKDHPRPSESPNKKEGVSFYYETSEGDIFTTLAEIVTTKKNKRQLGEIREIASVGDSPEARMSHFFKKARAQATHRKDFIDEILRMN
jgi:hypothetical protein